MLRIVILASLIACTLGYVFNVPITPTGQKIENIDWIRRQKLIIPLFENVCEISSDTLIVRYANEFFYDTSIDDKFDNLDDIITLKNHISEGLIPKGEIFTEYNSQHYKELKIVRDVFYSAKDFETFYKVASWARQNINCGLFVDAIYSAIVFRRDTDKLIVPPPYEVLPNYFFTSDAIYTGSELLSDAAVLDFNNFQQVGNSYIIYANYTSDEESTLAYFHEDIGLNTYIFLKKTILKQSWTVRDADYSLYGEYLYHSIKQLVARYNLERYSNGLMDVAAVNWMKNIYDFYDPMLVYSNGEKFSSRTKFVDMQSIPDANMLINVENTIPNVVSRMVQSGSGKMEIINALMEILVASDNSYEYMLYKSIGKNMDSISSAPSSLEHFMTLARDPVFWRINKKIIDIVDDALSVLPKYTRNELYFPGVEVVNVEFKKIMTFCDDYEIEVTDALKSTESQTNFQVKFKQQRLNHKSFTMKLNITSLAPQKGLVKVYIGPKVLPGEFMKNKDRFMLLDSFETNFKVGSNIISRPTESINFSNDFTSLSMIRKKVEDAEYGLNVLPFESIQKIIQFPSRLLLPKGSETGTPYQIFVYVAPYSKIVFSEMFNTNIGFNSAILSPNFPMDLAFDDMQMVDLPNALLKDVIITHKASSTDGSSGPYQKPYNSGQGYQYNGGSNNYYDKKEMYSSRKLLLSMPVKSDKSKPKWTKYIKNDKEEDVTNQTPIIDTNEKVVSSDKIVNPIISTETNFVDPRITNNVEMPLYFVPNSPKYEMLDENNDIYQYEFLKADVPEDTTPKSSITFDTVVDKLTDMIKYIGKYINNINMKKTTQDKKNSFDDTAGTKKVKVDVDADLPSIFNDKIAHKSVVIDKDPTNINESDKRTITINGIPVPFPDKSFKIDDTTGKININIDLDPSNIFGDKSAHKSIVIDKDPTNMNEPDSRTITINGIRRLFADKNIKIDDSAGKKNINIDVDPNYIFGDKSAHKSVIIDKNPTKENTDSFTAKLNSISPKDYILLKLLKPHKLSPNKYYVYKINDKDDAVYE